MKMSKILSLLLVLAIVASSINKIANKKAAAAVASGRFKDEIVPVVIPATKKTPEIVVNKDEYRFVYEDRRLVSWQKTIKDYNFGADAMHARGVIEYEDGDIACVTYYENNDAPIYYRCTPSAFYNTTGLFPETLSKQMGCFGFEHLYYAGLMGRGTKHLVQTILVDYADEAREEDYRIDFSYSTNKEDHVQLCTFILDGEAVSVNYGY